MMIAHGGHGRARGRCQRLFLCPRTPRNDATSSNARGDTVAAARRSSPEGGAHLRSGNKRSFIPDPYYSGGAAVLRGLGDSAAARGVGLSECGAFSFSCGYCCVRTGRAPGVTDEKKKAHERPAASVGKVLSVIHLAGRGGGVSSRTRFKFLARRVR